MKKLRLTLVAAMLVASGAMNEYGSLLTGNVKYISSLLGLLVAFSSIAAQASIPVTGNQIPMETAQAELLRKDCTSLKMMESTASAGQKTLTVPSGFNDPKWKISYEWKFPATKLVSDGMATPYAILKAEREQSGSSSTDLDPRSFKLESSHVNNLNFIGITLTLNASSYELCQPSRTMEISAKLDWNNAAGPAPYTDLKLTTLKSSN